MTITHVQANNILNYVFGKTEYTPPTNFYIGLTTGSVDINGTTLPIEPTDLAYARVLVVNNKSSFSNATTLVPAVITNSITITFSESSASWGNIINVFIADDPTAGNILYYDAVDITVGSNTTVYFSAGNIKISMISV